MKRREQDAIDAVARHFSATWETGAGSPDAVLTMAGTRIAVDVTSIKERIAARHGVTTPRLRFDRVVLRLIGDLQAALHALVPDGQIAIVTVTAPIRHPAKTVVALNDKIQGCLARRSARVEVREMIHGNKVRVRLVKGVARRRPKAIGFVHNPDVDGEVLLDMTQSLLACIGARVRKRVKAKGVGGRWLVIVGASEASHIKAYRHIYSQLSFPAAFKKILMVFSGGRVEELTG